jgi:hypothetical protein
MYSKDFTEYLRVLHGILGGSSTEYLICYEDRGGVPEFFTEYLEFGFWIWILFFVKFSSKDFLEKKVNLIFFIIFLFFLENEILFFCIFLFFVYLLLLLFLFYVLKYVLIKVCIK